MLYVTKGLLPMRIVEFHLGGSYGLHVMPNGDPSKKVFVQKVLPT
jgi:hypothetical protein